MKKLYIALLAAVLAGCASPLTDELLLDQLGGLTTISAESNKITGLGDIDAWFSPDGRIVGYVDNIAFDSDDGLVSINVYGADRFPISPFTFQSLTLAYRGYPAQWWYEDDINNGFRMYRSEEYGRNPQLWFEASNQLSRTVFDGGNTYFVQGTYANFGFHFITDGFGWFVRSFTETSNTPVAKDSVNLYFIQEGVPTSLGELPDYITASRIRRLFFADLLHGTILFGDATTSELSMATTSDGGISWQRSQAELPEGFDQFMEARGRQFRTYWFMPGTNSLYLHNSSDDSWNSYEFSNTRDNLDIRDVSWSGPLTAYAAVAGEDQTVDPSGTRAFMYRTQDGGQTWGKVGERPVYADHIDFPTDSVGMAISQDVIQFTVDASNSWFLRVAP
ncbi:hypothetical protein [Pontibacter sp. G13]|uniref:hypothetical protein n=1 Tax=Pontibacter sp. G13 TaxID=3074898 RepID=UPI00288C2D70|nr:hypothetical protein [Pontibacter sp. G13]WNJ18207.1 hypothetical protein RJD25_25430 [Pontibacter sp. G13]